MDASLKTPLPSQNSEPHAVVLPLSCPLAQQECEPSRRVKSSERRAREVHDLPHVMDRLERLGVAAQYMAYRDRYLSWRRGEPRGATGQVEAADLTYSWNAANRDPCDRSFYPTMQEWMFSRTISFWIAATFFEGSIFFSLSSFLYNCKDMLGDIYDPMTFYGFCCGKLLFIACVYFMCLDCVNFGIDGDDSTFYYNPFRWKTATRRLRKAGIGVLPYVVSVVYTVGVAFFTVGLAAEFLDLAEDVLAMLKNTVFLLGAAGFAVGGFFECVHNETFTSLNIDRIVWWTALLNFLGGTAFFIGAAVAWSNTFAENIWFGIGSLVYLASSCGSLVMWKNEQYGLTFLGAINKFNLRQPGSRGTDESPDAHAKVFSWWGSFFVTTACVCGAASAYNFNIEFKRYYHSEEKRASEFAILELVPCIIAHLVLILLSAVTRTPRIAPFFQLFIMLKVTLLAVTGFSVYTLCRFMNHTI